MNYQSNNDHIIINLGYSLDRDTIELQKKILAEVLKTKKLLIFKADEITKVDTASLQLLLSFMLIMTQENITWGWSEPSKILIEIVNLLGMHEVMKLSKK